MLFHRHLTVACALVLGLVACGGDAGTGDDDCDDCVCGNGVPDPGEDCETCPADVSGCTAVTGCGNDEVDDGESCDGAALGTRTCDTVGYDGGAIACGDDSTYDVSACCNDTCLAENQTMCIGDNLRRCTMGASGCLSWEITDCAATNDVCSSEGGAAACVCVDRCATLGEARCEGANIESCAMRADGCLDWTQSTDCTATGRACAVAPSGPMCVPDASAESCADAYPLAAGDNVIAWTANTADHLTAQPSCNATALTGPDLVLSYTAPEDGFVSFAMAKPASARQVIVVSSATCGTLTPEVACLSDSTPTTLGGEMGVDGGTTYYFYVRDTTSGTAPLAYPLVMNLTERRCSDLAVTVSSLVPANGTTVPNLAPVLSASLDYPASPTTGVITVTGNLGTNLSFDLATGPDNIALTDGGRTLVIDPGAPFLPGEMLTVSWSGLVDASCGRPIAPPAWTFQVSGPPCVPGTGGMVGTTTARLTTGIPSLTEQYVAVDEDPAGYVYVGGTTQLYRTPKAGGSTIDVGLAVPLTSANLGYDMLVDGSDVLTLDSNTTATTNQLFRISRDGGTSWAIENYLTLPQAPNDDFRAVTEYGGRMYLTTDETTAGTQIWSVPAASSVLPQAAVLETTLANEDNCSGLALDDTYYYLACGGLDRLLRVDRTTLAVELLTDVIDLNTTKNSLHAHDFDGDGAADALYVHSYHEEVYYVCEPTGAAPYWVDVLVSFGSGTSNYGLGFDRTAGTLWMFDDDTREFVSIE
jgi:hypothetical protein